MNWKSLVLNIIVIAALAIYTTILSGNNPINYVWYFSFVLLSAVLQYVIAENSNVKQNNEKLNSDIAELNKQLGLQILKGKTEGNNFFDLAIYPNSSGNVLRINNRYSLQICVNSVYQINKVPEILITTDKKWSIYDKNNNEIIPFEHNDKYLYTLKNCTVISMSNKYFVYEFIVVFQESGENEISILSESRDLRSEITNTIDILD